MLIKGISFLLITASILSPAFTTKTSAQSGEGRQNVTWINVINCSVTGNTLQKTAGRDDTSDAGARSQQQITSGEVFVEFTAGESNKTIFCGFAHNPVGTDYLSIDFGFKLTDFAVAEVRENNSYKAEIAYRIGDVFRISIQGGVVRYFKNNVFLYASQRAASFPLVVQAALFHVGARVENVVIGAAAVSEGAEWTMYQHDAAHTGYTTASSINANNVSTLTQAWSYQTGGWVTGTPIVAGGIVYVGSWDGKMHALREDDGSPVWSFTAGTLTGVPSNCGDSFGIDSTAALVNGRLYFGSASCDLYSLDAATGQQIWRTQLADPFQGFHLWSSPLVFEGKIYVGLGSHCGAVCVRGRMVCLDAATGRVLWTFYTAPEGSTGASVWSSFAIDAGRRMVYIATGNFCAGNDTYGDSIIGLNADTGVLVWHYKNAERDRDQQNFDFGASPVLFDTAGVPTVAVGSKDGSVYAVRRETGELLWRRSVVEGGVTSGIISSSAAAHGLVFAGAYENENGRLVALNQQDGQVVWEAILPAQTNGASAVAGGVVFIGAVDGYLRAYDALTGAPLWSVQRGAMYGGVSISQNHVFIGSADGNVYAFALSSVIPPPPPPPPPTVSISVSAPLPGDEWKKGKKYDVRWAIIGSVSSVNVSISRDGGSTWTMLAENVDASLGSVRVKAKKPKSNAVMVQVADSSNPNVFGRSGTFVIE